MKLSDLLPAIGNAVGGVGQQWNDAGKKAAVMQKIQDGQQLSPDDQQLSLQNHLKQEADATNMAMGFVGGGGSGARNVISKVVAPDIAKSLYGTEHTAAIQDALQRNGVTDINNVASAARGLYDKTINPTLSTSPKLISIDHVTNAIVGEMRKLSPELDPTEAKQAAHSVIKGLYNIGRQGASHLVSNVGGGPAIDAVPSSGLAEPARYGYHGPAVETPGYSGNTGAMDINPTHIDTPSLFKIRQGLNDTQAVKNHYAGNPPTKITDFATIAGRNALSNIIAAAHPEIAQATHDYGLLKDAVPSLYKATQDADKEAANQPSFGDKYIPHSILGTDIKPLYNAGHDVLTNPIGQKVALAGLGAAGALGFPLAKNYLDNTFNGHAQDGGDDDGGKSGKHDQSISQQYSDSKPDASGAYHLPTQTTPDPKSPYITDQQFSDMTAGMSPNSTEYQRLHTQWQASKQQAQAKFQNNTIMRFMDQADNYFSQGSVLENEVKGAPQGFWNDVRGAKGIQSYMSGPNVKSNYTGVLADIDTQNQQFAGAFRDATGRDPGKDLDLSIAQSPNQFRTILDRQQAFVARTWNTYHQPYLVVTSPTGAQTSNGKAQAITPITHGVGGTSLPTGGDAPSLNQMPAIPSAVQQSNQLPAIQ